MASSISYHRSGENQYWFGAAERMRCAITTHSTEARVSMSLIENLSILALIARSVNSGVRFLLHDQAQTSALTFTNRESQ
jgi:hypothetical protein